MVLDRINIAFVLIPKPPISVFIFQNKTAFLCRVKMITFEIAKLEFNDANR